MGRLARGFFEDSALGVFDPRLASLFPEFDCICHRVFPDVLRPSACKSGILIRWLDCAARRTIFRSGSASPFRAGQPFERAAAMRGLSVAGFVEWLVGRALADAGPIEHANPEGP
jgi:hypothetical protein